MFKTVDSTHNINRLELKWNKIFFQCYQLYMGYSCSDKLKCMLWKKVFGRLLGISTTLWHSMHRDRAAGIFHGAWVQWKGIQRTRISESKLNGNSLVGNSYCTFNGYCHWKPVKCSLILLYIFFLHFLVWYTTLAFPEYHIMCWWCVRMFLIVLPSWEMSWVIGPSCWTS